MTLEHTAWEPLPTVTELLRVHAEVLYFYFNNTDNRTLAENVRILADNRFSWNDLMLSTVFAIFMALFRRSLTMSVFQRQAKYYKLSKESAEKLPECTWKLVFHFISLSSTFYLVCWKYQFFQRPSKVWQDWDISCEVPADIYAVYILHASYYLYSFYSVLKLDCWRTDSELIILHHIITVFSLFNSLAFRCHNVGILVIFCHDISDVLLEFSKLNVYLKVRDNKLVKFNEVLSNITFTLLAVTWAPLRIYLFPLKTMYCGDEGEITLSLAKKYPYILIGGLLLWMLVFMNIYWFKVILVISARVITGQLKAVDDIRESKGQEKRSIANGEAKEIWSKEHAEVNGIYSPMKKKLR